MKKLSSILAVALVLGLIVVSSCDSSTVSTNQVDAPISFAANSLEKHASDMFTGEENHRISSPTAHDMISRYDQQFSDKGNGWFFGRDALVSLLSQDNIAGVRIYNSLKQDGEYSPVLFAVTPDGHDLDIDPSLSKSTADSTLIILELAYPCPPFCD